MLAGLVTGGGAGFAARSAPPPFDAGTSPVVPAPARARCIEVPRSGSGTVLQDPDEERRDLERQLRDVEQQLQDLLAQRENREGREQRWPPDIDVVELHRARSASLTERLAAFGGALVALDCDEPPCVAIVDVVSESNDHAKEDLFSFFNEVAAEDGLGFPEKLSLHHRSDRVWAVFSVGEVSDEAQLKRLAVRVERAAEEREQGDFNEWRR